MLFARLLFIILSRLHNYHIMRYSRPVLFVVQEMNGINKSDCINDTRIPQCTKMKICIHRQYASAVQPKNANEICHANASLLY